MTWQVALARLRFPLVVGLAAVLLLSAVFGWPPAVWLVVLVAYVVLVRAGTVQGDPVVVRPPVRGRWKAINSPADRVPSHGVQVYGQAYAIDLAHEPDDPTRPRPAMRWWPLARRPTDYPAFGEPVLAPADATVVRVHGRERDHWSRSSWPSLAYLIPEGLLRELTGPNRIVGNHVVLDLGDGRFALTAHLQQRSVAVSVGDRVRAGDVIGRCGNSGNSSEPHVHFQVMDHPHLLFAAGLPMAFDRYEVQGGERRGLPSAKEAPFDVAEAAVRP